MLNCDGRETDMFLPLKFEIRTKEKKVDLFNETFLQWGKKTTAISVTVFKIIIICHKEHVKYDTISLICLNIFLQHSALR